MYLVVALDTRPCSPSQSAMPSRQTSVARNPSPGTPRETDSMLGHRRMQQGERDSAAAGRNGDEELAAAETAIARAVRWDCCGCCAGAGCEGV